MFLFNISSTLFSILVYNELRGEVQALLDLHAQLVKTEYEVELMRTLVQKASHSLSSSVGVNSLSSSIGV